MKYKLSISDATTAAKELTLKAIENDLFTDSGNPKENAENIAEFMNTLIDLLTTEK